MNLCVFEGRLVADPEVRKAGDVTVVNFRLAVDNEMKKDDATFLDFEAWAQGAEIIAKWFKKGSLIIIRDATAKNDSWEDKTTGEKRSRVKFRVNRFLFPPINKGNLNVDEESEPEPTTKTEDVPKTTTSRRGRRPASPPIEETEDDSIPF